MVCSSAYLDFFTACSFFKQDHNAGKLTFKLAEKSGRTSSSTCHLPPFTPYPLIPSPSDCTVDSVVP